MWGKTVAFTGVVAVWGSLAVFCGCRSIPCVTGMTLSEPTPDEEEILLKFLFYHVGSIGAENGAEKTEEGIVTGDAFVPSNVAGDSKRLRSLLKVSSDEFSAAILAPSLQIMYPRGCAEGTCRTVFVDLLPGTGGAAPQDCRTQHLINPPVRVQSLFSESIEQPEAKLSYDLYVFSLDPAMDKLDLYLSRAEFRQHRILYFTKDKDNSWQIVREKRIPIGTR